MSNTEQIIETVTTQVLAALGYDLVATCPECHRSCVVGCSDKVRTVVDAGASRISFNGNGAEVPRDLARYIDHTLLKPDASVEEIDTLCREAVTYGFKAVCVNPTWVRRAAGKVRGSDVGVASVVGFPLGANTADIKAAETRRALRDGATEIDMVINVGALKSADLDLVKTDIARVSDACHEAGAINKVIIEAALLTDEEKVIASHLVKEGRADYVKTSTGFGPGGATVFDVALLREVVGSGLGVKAAGGIRTRETFEEMIAAGATRIGASAGIRLLTGGNGDDERH